MLKNIVKNLEPSSTLKINEISRNLEKEGKKIFKFGFGQSPFEMGDYINELKVENTDRPSKIIIYPLAIFLLLIFGYLNSRRTSLPIRS